MDTTSRIMSSPEPQRLGGDQLDLARLNSDIFDLNRQITAAVTMELATGSLSDELARIIAARDLLRARLATSGGQQIADGKTTAKSAATESTSRKTVSYAIGRL